MFALYKNFFGQDEKKSYEKIGSEFVSELFQEIEQLKWRLMKEKKVMSERRPSIVVNSDSRRSSGDISSKFMKKRRKSSVRVSATAKKHKKESDAGRMRKNVAYQLVRKEVDARNRTRVKNRDKASEVYYVDRDRAAAVVLGTKDIRKEFRNKHRRDKHQKLENKDEEEEIDIYILVLQGQHELKSGDPARALTYFIRAMEAEPDNINLKVMKSNCFVKMALYDQANDCASEALEVDPNCVRGILAKAEAMYQLGNFEHALKYFYRGLQLRPELNSFVVGIRKSRDAISNCLSRKFGFNFDSMKHEISQIEKETRMIEIFQEKEANGWDEEDIIKEIMGNEQKNDLKRGASGDDSRTTPLLGDRVYDRGSDIYQNTEDTETSTLLDVGDDILLRDTEHKFSVKGGEDDLASTSRYVSSSSLSTLSCSSLSEDEEIIGFVTLKSLEPKVINIPELEYIKTHPKMFNKGENALQLEELNSISQSHSAGISPNARKLSIKRRKRMMKQQAMEKREKRANRYFLGKLNDDKMYLENLMRSKSHPAKYTKSPNVPTLILDEDEDETKLGMQEKICREAEEALNFLNMRKDFWQQHQPRYAIKFFLQKRKEEDQKKKLHRKTKKSPKIT
ncbi:uncharacterized protein [Lepeophtheirus salmonis]|uniref:uncharacterized protein isoform X1 n=2 Tax=Lepeophtheirus salmonis TaxID=72036 RepID=UPI003AF3CAC2